MCLVLFWSGGFSSEENLHSSGNTMTNTQKTKEANEKWQWRQWYDLASLSRGLRGGLTEQVMSEYTSEGGSEQTMKWRGVEHPTQSEQQGHRAGEGKVEGRAVGYGLELQLDLTYKMTLILNVRIILAAGLRRGWWVVEAMVETGRPIRRWLQ